MREGLTIAHNEDLAFRNHDWKTAQFNKIDKKVKESSAKFESEQKAMRVEKVVGESSQLESGRKEARILDLLKRKHGGPITSAEQVDELLEKEEYQKDRKKLKLALENEISFAKKIFKDIPAKSPLFVQRKNSVEQLANNLKLLYGRKNNDTIEAGLADLETALMIIEKNNMEVNKDENIAIEKIIAITQIFFNVNAKHLNLKKNIAASKKNIAIKENH